MTHAFHTGRDARYTGAATIPRTGSPAVPAAALVLLHPKLKVQLDPMYRPLDACPTQQSVEAIRLVPITVVDFYAKRDVLPDLHPLGSEEHAAGAAEVEAGHLRAGPAVGVPAAGGHVRHVPESAARRRRGATGVEGAY